MVASLKSDKENRDRLRSNIVEFSEARQLTSADVIFSFCSPTETKNPKSFIHHSTSPHPHPQVDPKQAWPGEIKAPSRGQTTSPLVLAKASKKKAEVNPPQNSTTSPTSPSVLSKSKTVKEI